MQIELPADPFEESQTALVTGLVQAKQYNGRLGSLILFNAAEGRWHVQLADDEAIRVREHMLAVVA